MKLTKIIAIIFIALCCVMFHSCTKAEPSQPFGSSIWSGHYPVQMLNNDTKEMEDHTACISLEFSHSGYECTVVTGIVGMYATSRTNYDVKWYSELNFSLSVSKSGQTIVSYGGTINDKLMSLNFLSCDKIERTIELVKAEQ